MPATQTICNCKTAFLSLRVINTIVTRRVSVRFWECVVVGGGGGGGWWGGSVCVWGYPGVKGGLLYRNC